MCVTAPKMYCPRFLLFRKILNMKDLLLEYENRVCRLISSSSCFSTKCKKEKLYFAVRGQLTKVVSSDYGRLERSLISFRKGCDICSLKKQIWQIFEEKYLFATFLFSRLLLELKAEQRWLGRGASHRHHHHRHRRNHHHHHTDEQVSLDYDLLSYKLTNLSCGSVYSFNLVAHNIAGRSKPRWVFQLRLSKGNPYPFTTTIIIIILIIPHHLDLTLLISATITTPTLGSAPEQLTNQRIISGESNIFIY